MQHTNLEDFLEQYTEQPQVATYLPMHTEHFNRIYDLQLKHGEITDVVEMHIADEGNDYVIGFISNHTVYLSPEWYKNFMASRGVSVDEEIVH